MFWRKGLLIGGTTLIAAIIGGVALLNNTTKPVTITEDSLLQNYEQLLKDAQQQAAQDCDDPKVFSQQTKNLEEKLDKLRQQKKDLIAETDVDEYIPPIPGSEPLDMEEEMPAESDEYIPPIPGSESPADIGWSETTDEYIPPIPGSETPTDIGPSESSETTDDYIPPIPGSEPLDLDEGAITTIQKINNIEIDIRDILDTLETKCNQEEPSGDCETACKNYNSKCLSLVPNASQSMLDDWFSSCMALCKKRSEEKVQCMEDAKDCVAMSEVCGL